MRPSSSLTSPMSDHPATSKLDLQRHYPGRWAYVASKESVIKPGTATKIHFDIHMNVHFFTNHKEALYGAKAHLIHSDVQREPGGCSRLRRNLGDATVDKGARIEQESKPTYWRITINGQSGTAQVIRFNANLDALESPVVFTAEPGGRRGRSSLASEEPGTWNVAGDDFDRPCQLVIRLLFTARKPHVQPSQYLVRRLSPI